MIMTLACKICIPMLKGALYLKILLIRNGTYTLKKQLKLLIYIVEGFYMNLAIIPMVKPFCV